MPHPAESAVVPSVSDLDDKWGIKKEALRSLNATEKGAALSAGFDEVLAAVGKRATRPVTLIDDGLKALICRIASAMLLGWRRGFKPTAGQDGWIAQQLDAIEKDLEDIRRGRVEYYFVDSTVRDEQGPRGGGDATADAWTKGGCGYPLPFGSKTCC
jgi:hypothetical protein